MSFFAEITNIFNIMHFLLWLMQHTVWWAQYFLNIARKQQCALYREREKACKKYDRATNLPGVNLPCVCESRRTLCSVTHKGQELLLPAVPTSTELACQFHTYKIFCASRRVPWNPWNPSSSLTGMLKHIFYSEIKQSDI